MTGRNPFEPDWYRRYDRRAFLRAMAVLGVGAAGGGILRAASDVVRTTLGPSRVTQTRVAMGTFVTMTAITDSRNHAAEAIGRAFEEIDKLVGVFSRYDSSTPLAVWNRDGVLTDPPPELVMLIRRAIEVHRMSAGAFDITVEPLVDLFREKAGRVTQREIDDVLPRIGVGKLEITDKRLRFLGEGMGVTLDGIAKGYIVDRASHVLTSSGVTRHLVNAGGDIRASGEREDGTPWRIVVQDPQKHGHYPDSIRMTNGAVATSGSYEVFYDRDRVHHHVVDPRSGNSPTQSTSVSVVADNVMTADALSTAVFVMRRSEGLRMIDSLEGCACLVVDRTFHPYRSNGWKGAGPDGHHGGSVS